MYRARYQYGSFGSLWIPRAKLIHAEEDNFIDRGSANPGPNRSYTYYEKKYGKPDESNVEGYWIDDEKISQDLQGSKPPKPTGKERKRQQELERERDYSDMFGEYYDYYDYWDRDYGSFGPTPDG